MGKIKLIFYVVLAFVIYKGYVAFTNFEIGVEDRVAKIEEKAEFEREGTVIGLMMYLGAVSYTHLTLPTSDLV